MRPWMGAVAVAAAMLVSRARRWPVDDDPALMKFKAARAATQYDDFEALGLDMDHSVENGNGDDRSSSARG